MVETRRVGPRHKKSSPPILSHEFVIQVNFFKQAIKKKTKKSEFSFNFFSFFQNHGDIITCFVMLFLFGLMFPVSSILNLSY